MKTWLKLYLMSLALFSIVSCNESGSSSDTAIKDTARDTFETDVPATGSVINGQCYEDQYALSDPYITRKVDILIVADTSGSLIEERQGIAQGFDYFISTLPAEIDFRIGVMLAHSTASNYGSKLYKKGTEPMVLDSELHSVADIKAHLSTKLQNPAGESYTDGGEIGLYSLLHSLDADKLTLIKSQGFYREDAALVVIFVTDEQDICASFPQGIIPVPDPQGAELRSLSRFCKDTNGNFLVTPQIVVDNIKQMKGDMPVVFGGIVYNNSATMPRNGENELAYGVLETIEYAAGITVDLANGDYGDGLNRIGRLATTSIAPINSFNIGTANVNPASIEILVNGNSEAFTYDSILNQVNLTNERDPFSVVNITYCERAQTTKEALKVVAGGYFTCAITNESNLKCWGQNQYGQLGLGNTDIIGDNETLANIPSIDMGGIKVTDMALGFRHACALLEDGGVRCWGDNSVGQLGLGHTLNYGDEANEVPANLSNLPLGEKAFKIYAGTYHTCALLQSNKVKCWGQNNFGQLGYGHINNIGDNETLDTLTYVSVGGLVTQMDISTISYHSCAVLTTGGMKCWGNNTKGQLGLGHMNNIGDDELPSSIASITFSEQILQLTTGSFHTCAIVTGQKMRCWGDNAQGQIGMGNTAIIIGDNELVNTNDNNLFDFGNVTILSAGNRHTCGVNLAGEGFCFGQGSFGALGLSSTQSIGDNELANLNNSKINFGGKSLAQISSGLNHTCGLFKDDGKVICWGQNQLGQLGLGHLNTIGDNENPIETVSLFPETP